MQKNNSYLYSICAVAMFGGLMFGFDIAIISGANASLQSYFHLSELELGWGTSSLILGAIFGAIISGILTDRYGRKVILLYTAFLFAFSCIATALCGTFSFYVLSRLIGGISVGAASVLSPMYVAEVAPQRLRGTLVSIYQFAIVTGILISYFVNYTLFGIIDDWRWMFATGAIPSILFFAGLWLIPESPRWLYLKGFNEKSREIFVRISGEACAAQEVAEIKKTMKFTNGVVKIKDMFFPTIHKSIVLGFFLSLLVQLNGMNVVINYAPRIFQSAGFEVSNALLFTAFIGIVNMLFTFVAIYLIDKIGRRKMYIAGSASMAVTLVVLSASYFFNMKGGILTIASVFIFIASFAACIGPVFWTLVSEIFPNRIRGKAVAFASFVQWITNFISLLLFPHLLKLLGGGTVFLFLSAMCLLQFVVSWIYLPETKGKSLEEIELSWNK